MKFYSDAAKSIRINLGLKTGYVAKKLKVSRRTLWTWEGSRNMPSEKMIRALADILSVKPCEISDIMDDDILSKIDLNKSSKINYDDDSKTIFDNKLNSLMNSLTEIYNEASDSNLITKALLSSGNMIFYIKNTSLKYIAVNNYYKTILGYPENLNFVNKGDFDFLPNKEAKNNEEEEREILLSGKSIVSRETSIPGTKGKRWGVFTKSPIFDKYNKISGLIVNAIDITDIKQEEQRIALLIGTVKKAGSSIWHAKFNARNNLVSRLLDNEIASDIFGSSKHFILNTERISQVIATFNSTKENSYIHEFEIEVDSIKNWFNETIYKDKDNYYGVIRPSSDEKNLDRFRKILEVNFANMDDGVIIQNDETKELVYANKAAEIIYGSKIEDHLNKNIDDIWLSSFIHPDDYEEQKELYKQNKYPRQRVFRIITPANEVKWIETTVSYRTLSDGVPTVITIDRDITERKNIEKNRVLLETFINELCDIVFIFDSLKILYISENIEKILGFPADLFYNDKNFFYSLCFDVNGKPLGLKNRIEFKFPESRTIYIKDDKNNIRIFKTISVDIKSKKAIGCILKEIIKGSS